MSFSKFSTIVIFLYSLYYLLLSLTDLVKKKVSAAGEDFNVEYDVDPEAKPVKVTVDNLENKFHESEGGQKQAVENFKGDVFDQSWTSEGYKSLGVDLGLETISTVNMEVTNNKRKM